MAEPSAVAATDTVELRRAFTLYPRGVMAVAAMVDGERSGLAVSAFVSLSLDPPLMIICIDNASSTWPTLSRAGTIGVSVIAEEDAWLGRQLGSKRTDRFAGVALREVEGGALLLENAVATFTTTLEHQYPGGDHAIVVLRVHDYSLEPTRSPLVWHDTQFAAVRRLEE